MGKQDKKADQIVDETMKEIAGGSGKRRRLC